jgi:hypothetical protein
MPQIRDFADLIDAAGIRQCHLVSASGVHQSHLSRALVLGMDLNKNQVEAVREALIALAETRIDGATRLLEKLNKPQAAPPSRRAQEKGR